MDSTHGNKVCTYIGAVCVMPPKTWKPLSALAPARNQASAAIDGTHVTSSACVDPPRPLELRPASLTAETKINSPGMFLFMV